MKNGQKLAIAGATIFVAEPAMQLAHFGGPGVIAGLVAGAVAYLAADEIHKVKQASGGDVSPDAIASDKSAAALSVGKRLLVGKSVREDAAPSNQKAHTVSLPRRSPTFAQMRHLIVPGNDILGYDGQKFISAESFKKSVNFALIGVPGSGKTVALSFHAAQAIMRGAIVRGWDLHGDVAADLGGMLHILEDVDEIVADCAWIHAERERRMALRKRAKSGDREATAQWNKTRELFYVVDEFNALMLRLKQRKQDREYVADTLLSLIAEGRKFKMRVIITGQTMPAALFGEGGSSARDIINTKYALQSRENHAQYFGIEQQAIEKLLPLIAGEESVGYAILDGGPLLHATIVSIPLTTAEDIRALLAEYETEEEDDLVEYMMRPGNTEERHTDELPVNVVRSGVREKRDIVAIRQQRMQRLRNTPVASEPSTNKPTQEESVEISAQAAFEVWSAGNSNVRDMAKALGISYYQGTKLYSAMVEKGLIEKKAKVVVKE